VCYSLGTIEVTDRIQFKSVLSQYAEWILNKVPKTFNETFLSWGGMHQKFRIFFFLKFWRNGYEICQLGSLANLAGGFYGLQYRISRKIYSEHLMHTLLPCEGSVESFFNLIQNPMSILCYTNRWKGICLVQKLEWAIFSTHTLYKRLKIEHIEKQFFLMIRNITV